MAVKFMSASVQLVICMGDPRREASEKKKSIFNLTVRFLRPASASTMPDFLVWGASAAVIVVHEVVTMSFSTFPGVRNE